uniref:Uncharacterized protein n=1 Tax=Gossypium raimondii TaxID=29730 RepID=A0A0D2SQK0_GOSRA|nr:hypothetical protein B456_007G368800 [Gossypium raimondii]
MNLVLGGSKIVSWFLFLFASVGEIVRLLCTLDASFMLFVGLLISKNKFIDFILAEAESKWRLFEKH